MEFTIYDDDDVAPFLEGLEERPQRKVPAQSPYWSRQLVRGGSPADLLCVCASRLLSPLTNPPPHRRLTSPWSTDWEGQSQHCRLNVCGRRRRSLCRDVPLEKTVDSKLFSADISQRDVAFVWVTLSMIQEINSFFGSSAASFDLYSSQSSWCVTSFSTHLMTTLINHQSFKNISMIY